MRFNSKYGVLTVQQAYYENIALKKGGTLSLYWVKGQDVFKAAIIRRYKGKVFAEFSNSWQEAKRIFTQRIVKEGKRNGQRILHTLSLYVAPDQHSDLYRCIAICKNGRKAVDVLHAERVGSIAKAFKALRAECGCRHRKRYEMLDGHWFSTYQGVSAISYAEVPNR